MPAPDDVTGEPRPISLLAPRRASSLQHLAREFEARHGPARGGAGQPESIIDRAARKLAASQGDFSVLDEREKKAALELFWRRIGPWIARTADVEAWLLWAAEEWKPRIAETRVCAALLRHFDPRHPTTALICGWLAERQDQLWGRFGDFARRWRLFDGAEAAEKAGAMLAAGDLSFLQDIKRNAHARILLQAAGFVVAVLEAFARHSAQRTDDDAWLAAGALLDLFGPRGLKGAGGPDFLRAEAKIAAVCGLVDWAAARATEEAMDRALALCFRLAGDPRADLADWREIPPKTLAQVEKWLAGKTLAAAFRIVAELKTDDPAVLQQRESFWRAYLPHVARARLLGARKAQQAAARLREPCSDLKTYLSDHCGFLLEIQGKNGESLIVVEMNNLAQTMFWPAGRANAPTIDQKSFDGSLLRAKCDLFLSHLPPDAWPMRFADLIAQQTGLAAPIA